MPLAGQLWTLWSHAATGGRWELLCEGDEAGVRTKQKECRRADPEWHWSMIVCEPGESPALMKRDAK